MTFIFNPYVISLIALIFAGYTFWDTHFHFKLEVEVGRQIKLWAARADEGRHQPVILMSLAFTNSGGKTECLQDIKLNVTLTSNNRNLWSTEFQSLREYDTLLADASKLKQVEILPLVIVGKTTEIRKYVCFPIEILQQDQIPKSFDLTIKVYTKHRSKWKPNKTYEVKNVSDVWQDLNNESNFRYSLRDICEKR